MLFWFLTTSAFASEAWNSKEGLLRLERSQFKNDFYQLVNFYQPQINPLYCSVASSVMILNAIKYGEIPSQKSGEISKPDGGKIEFKLFTQEGFLNDETDKIKPHTIIKYQDPNQFGIYDAGLSIADLAKILTKVYNLKVVLTHIETVDEKQEKKFRQTIKKILIDRDKFLITNFDGKILGHQTRGHISPLVAYDDSSDSVLILDVALHKNQWFWISVNELLKAMNSKDNDSYRGYLVVE